METRAFVRAGSVVLALSAAVFVVRPLPCESGGSASAGKAALVLPELPRAHVDTTHVPPTGETIRVPEGGDLQSALDSAKPGDVILLAAGATFAGPFTLPSYTGTASGWITVRSDASDRNLPALDHRVAPSHAPYLAKITAPRGWEAIHASPAAHHFRLIGLEITPRDGYVYNLVALGLDSSGASVTKKEDLPHHLIFDRCYIHGDPVAGTRRGILLDARWAAVIGCYISDCADTDHDSQAIGSWNGAGPYKIVNNYLEGAGENVIFGGSDPAIAELVASDIEIRGNHLKKPLSWKIGDASYAGTAWRVKNLFELKNARRVLVEGNVFENNWVQADQDGFAIVLTPRNQDGGAPWSVVADVTFQRNLVRHTGGGFNILGVDTYHPSDVAHRILIAGNLVDDLDGEAWGSAYYGAANGRCFLVGTGGGAHGPKHLTIDHNTVIAHTRNQSAIIIGDAHGPKDKVLAFTFQNNVISYGDYGVFGGGVGSGTPALTTYCMPGWILKKNVFFGTPGGTEASAYPGDNSFLASIDDVGFVGAASGDYHLASSSAYAGAATDGADLGADQDALDSATSGAVQPGE
ncbi:hypothetical protein HY251_15850 [bacterium]|nr:hypothetical protein [bacterium]